ncbi:unnamed protein product, partial [Effrenium voratum]
NARQALQYFVMLTKEAKKTGVVLITSDFGYPFRLRNCGMNLQDIQRIINVNEVPKADMLQLMVDRWGMSEDLGKEFFSYFGGNIDLCSAAVKELARKRSALDPFCIVDCPGLPACAADPDAKTHLQNMLEHGWSPVYNLKLDAAAKLIAEENVGGIVAKRSEYFDQPENMWNGNHEFALVPSGTLMRWKIGKELARMESMESIGKVASQPPPAVWVCQLGSPDGKDFEIVGNAFKITASVSDVDDLKKAPPLKGLKSNFAHAVLRAVCRRAMTKMEGLSDFNSERFLRPSSRRSQTESYAMLMKLTFTAKRTAAGSRKPRCQQVCTTQMRQTATDSCYQLELLEPHSLRLLLAVVTCYSRLRQCWGTTFHVVQ